MAWEKARPACLSRLAGGNSSRRVDVCFFDVCCSLSLLSRFVPMNNSFTAFGTRTPIRRVAEQSDAVKILFALPDGFCSYLLPCSQQPSQRSKAQQLTCQTLFAMKGLYCTSPLTSFVHLDQSVPPSAATPSFSSHDNRHNSLQTHENSRDTHDHTSTRSE